MTTIVLTDNGNGTNHVIAVGRLLVAGFTGRDQDAVAAHVAELAELGVPVPERTPSLYELEPALLRQSTVLAVSGADTSGEAEPVLVVDRDGRQWLTLGSDHTDRVVERTDIAASKAACAKILATEAVPLDLVSDLDEVELWSRIDDVDYQRGSLAEIAPFDQLLAQLATDHDLELRAGDVVFFGTLPTIGGIRPTPTLRAGLRVPSLGATLTLTYRTLDLSSSGRNPLAKPELEFTAVSEIAWTPVPGVDGQRERILAADVGSGTATRMLHFAPGTDTSMLGPLRHDFWEEVYILEGELHDLTLDEKFPAGTYACRPPGMPHGPWRSDPGCTTFEVRYPAM